MQLRYGSGSLDFAIPPSWQVEEILFRPYPPLTDPAAAVLRALREPIGAPPLRDIVNPGETVCILVNDATRKARSEVFLLLLLDELNATGVPDSDVFIVVAVGTHRQATPHDVAGLVSQGVAGRAAIHSHDCRDQGNLTYVGTTSRGTPVHVNTRVVQADRRILTGSVVHHWFQGFGGGKKVLVPGVAGYETIRANHALMLDPACRTGVLDGNPAADDLLEAARLVGGDFLVNTVLDPDGEILGVFAGEMDLAHRAACRLAHQVFAGYQTAPADLVLASCGGWPKDIDLYQSQKSLENAALACRPGGVIVLAAECGEGIGSAKYWEWVRAYPTLLQLEEAIRDHFELGGHKAWAMAKLTSRNPVVLLSSMPAETVRALGFHPAASPAEALALAAGLLPAAGPVRAVVMPCVSLTLPMP